MDKSEKEEFYYGYATLTYINSVPIEGILFGYDKDGQPIYIDGRIV